MNTWHFRKISSATSISVIIPKLMKIDNAIITKQNMVVNYNFFTYNFYSKRIQFV